MKRTIYQFLVIASLFSLSNCKKDNNSNSTYNLKDKDGNVYNTVKIGEQTWMKENLRTTKYNDGTSIPLVKNNSSWTKLNTAGYCFYNNDDAAFKSTYGALYNWYAVSTNKLCPAGWHVPSNEEWNSLATALGGQEVAGSKMKTTGTIEEGTGLWHNPNSETTNSSGFSSLPGGSRYAGTGNFMDLGEYANYWSSTEDIYMDFLAYNKYLTSDGKDLYRYSDFKRTGYSVRCLKN